MKPHRKVYLVGGGHSTFMGRSRPEFIHSKHSDYGERKNPNIEDHLRQALRSAYDATGIDPGQCDKAYLSNFLGERFINQGHLGSLLVDVEPRLDGKPIARIEAACASGASAIAAGVDALQAGFDVVLAAGAEIETNVPGSEGIEHMALAAHMDKQRSLDTFIFPYFFALRAKAYCESTPASLDDVAQIVTKAYGNANLNPKALNQSVHMTFEHASTPSTKNYLFLEDPSLKHYMRLTDCTAFTDGASAVFLASEDGLKRLGVQKNQCIELMSYGHSTAPLSTRSNPLFMDNMARAAQVAYTDAGISGQAVSIAEVHDCFAIAELQMYEAVGLCPAGEGYRLLRDGDTLINGRIPVNTGGGLLGFGHPIGATGIKQAVEIWRQMKGLCGDYQVERNLDFGVTANLGGDDRTGIVMVYENLG